MSKDTCTRYTCLYEGALGIHRDFVPVVFQLTERRYLRAAPCLEVGLDAAFGDAAVDELVHSSESIGFERRGLILVE